MIDRRTLFSHAAGLGGVALASLIARGESRAPRTHHAPRATRVVQFFMAGGASAVDLFDHKPQLVKHHGKPSDFGEPVEAFQNGLGPWLRPAWDFRPYGQSGKMLSDAVAPLGRVVDDIAFIHNVTSKSGVHSSATLLQATGFTQPGFPGAGCWVSHGLGSLSDDLPTFVVLPDHRGYASNGVKNWDAAFLPAMHSGTVVSAEAAAPLADLSPHAAGTDYLSPAADADGRALLSGLNQLHADARAGDPRLDARTRAYALAARLQLAAPEAFDLSRESRAALRLYGLDMSPPREWPREINDAEETYTFGKKCLIARRLLERGVRFVQIWSGNNNGFPRRNWDSHEDVRRDHGPLARGMARGAAALVADLKQRGLLDDTIVLWTTEFGRMPSSQGGAGRDHNPYCFTNWLCGAGVRGGVSHGPSDEWGYKPLDRKRPTEVYDVYASLLHLLGFDHTRLTVRHGGIDRRLTDVHGHVIREVLV